MYDLIKKVTEDVTDKETYNEIVKRAFGVITEDVAKDLEEYEQAITFKN